MARSGVVLFWRVLNPVVRPLAGLAPWWVLVETTGRKSGQTRRTPLAAGPRDATGMWLIAVHGRRSGWVLNAEGRPAVRLKHRGRWHDATARVVPWDEQVVARCGAYARSGPRLLEQDPVLVHLAFAG